MLIEIICRLGEFARRIMMLGADDAILHVAVAGDHNQQHALVRQAQKLQVLERVAAALRRHHDAGEFSEIGQHLRRGSEQALRIGGIKLAFELIHLALFQRRDGHQGIDKKTVTARRGDAARRGVRAGDKAQLLQVRHDVADRRGR